MRTDRAQRLMEPGRRAGRAVSQSLLWRVMTLVVVGMAGVLAAFAVVSLLAVNESRDQTLDERQALARAAGSSPSKWVVRRLVLADRLEELLVDRAQSEGLGDDR